MSTRLKKVILVAPEVFPVQLTAGYADVKHVRAIGNIFPSIFELNPDLVIFDYDFLGKDTEKILRRIQANKFYDKIKVFCYKNAANTRTDDLLKTLGVDHFIYKEDLETARKSKTVLTTVNSILDNSIIKLVASVSN